MQLLHVIYAEEQNGGTRSSYNHFICTTCWDYRRTTTDVFPVNNLGGTTYGFDAPKNGINATNTTSMTWTITHNTIYSEACGKNAANPSYKSYDF